MSKPNKSNDSDRIPRSREQKLAPTGDIPSASGAGPQSYEYCALEKEQKEIRLLVVHPAPKSSTATVQCSIKHVSLLPYQKPEYETISYCCGDKTRRANIIVDKLPLEITASAERVLRRMRYPDKDRILWIDAVCINQNDVEERGHQVALMTDVYSTTFRNLVWLGEDDGSTGAALDAIAAVLAEARRETENFNKFLDTLVDEGDRRIYARNGLSISINHTALLHFFETEWFCRVWVVQEAALPPQSFCYRGDQEVALLDVLRVASWLQHKMYHLPFWISGRILNAVTMWEYSLDVIDRFEPDMINLLIHLRDFEAYDPRDHVYGLLGLYRKLQPVSTVSHDAPNLIVPDYKKPLADVLRQASTAALQESRSLDLLNCVRHRQQRSDEDGGFPSWVPRWDQKLDPSRDANYLRYSFRANGDYAYHGTEDGTNAESYSSNPNILHIKGMTVAAVGRPSPVFKPNATAAALSDTIVSFQHVFTEKAPTLRQEDNDIILATTLVAATGLGAQPANLDFVTRSYTAWLRYIRDVEEFPPSLQIVQSSQSGTPEHDREAAEYNQAFSNACVNRCLFATTTGHAGLGPQTMQQDDIVVILYGCRWPVILRQCTGSNEHEFVGVSYVHGIMHGEAVSLSLAGSREEVVFHIR